MTNDQIQEILKVHSMWLNSAGEKGERANLSRADLSRADLREANLCEANLYGADLYGADLSRANLCEANLSRVDLSRADLREANLCEANLYGANLYGADLSRANLCEANLCEVDLYEANLYEANLYGANLCGAKNIPYVPMVCPSDGSFIGWKKAHNMIIKLQIPEDAKRSSATGRKCRCDKAIVLAIEYLDGFATNLTSIKSDFDGEFVYCVGEMVTVDDFDTDRFNECAPGIHFFISRQEAVDY